MGIWAVPAIKEDPIIELSRWRVLSIPSLTGSGQEHHFNGYNTAGYEGRVSSKIITYNANTRIGITRSGRRYRLIGEPGMDRDADYVWELWAKINKADLKKQTDVTKSYLKRTKKWRNPNRKGTKK